MITDKKITGYKGVGAHFEYNDGKSVLIIAEDADSLKIASKKFRDGKGLNLDQCQKVIVISASALNPPNDQAEP